MIGFSRLFFVTQREVRLLRVGGVFPWGGPGTFLWVTLCRRMGHLSRAFALSMGDRGCIEAPIAVAGCYGSAEIIAWCCDTGGWR